MALVASEGQPELQGIDYVHLLWCDAAGLRRCRVVPVYRPTSREQLLVNGVGLTTACMAVPAHADVCAVDAGIGAVGEIRLVPENLLIRQPWADKHAYVAVRMMTAEVDQQAWECCPRDALKRVLGTLHREHDITCRVGFETEFLLLDKEKINTDRGPEPWNAAVDRSVYSQSSAVQQKLEVLTEIEQALRQMDIKVEQFHAESANGQFEIVTDHANPLEAADKLLLTREAIQAVAGRHNLVACFLPKLNKAQAGSGCHCHISFHKAGQNLMMKGPGVCNFTEEGEALMSSILSHLDALLCFTLPSHISYARMLPGAWAGAYKIWGVQNREAPLRVCQGALYQYPTNLEYKAMDATANPHIALAAILTAALQGLQQLGQSPGPTLPPACSVDPSSLTSEARDAAGITALPVDLDEALKAFERDQGFRAAMEESVGAPLLKAFMAVRRSEQKYFDRMNVFLQEVKMLYDRY